MCVRQNPALKSGEVLKEFVSGVARTIHKGNEIIVRTADLRSMDALDPIERLPRRERILRAAAMHEVVDQIHRDQRQREEQRGQQQGSQAALQRRGSTATKDKTSTGNRQEASDRDSGEPPPGKMQASQPSDGQPSANPTAAPTQGVRRATTRSKTSNTSTARAISADRDRQQRSTTTTPEQTQGR